MAMLQAYIDDSKTDGSVLVLAGLVAGIERWKSFSDAWQFRLNHAPWDTFKMSEVWNRAGDISIEHAKWHYETIRDHVQGAICVVIPLAPLERAAHKHRLVGTAAANPYTWAIKGVINWTARHQTEWGADEPIDFIFDESAEEREVRGIWNHYLSTIPESVRALTGRIPRFEDDKKVLPLQAADMWAWWCRKTWKDNGGNIPPDSYPIPWGSAGDIPQMIFQWSETNIEAELTRVASDVAAAMNAGKGGATKKPRG